MALKRHELPPPGYFNRLPGEITARILRGEGQMGFWERLLSEITFRPAFAYGIAVAAFGALTFSVFNSVGTHPQQSAQNRPNSGWRTVTPDEALASQFNPSEPLHVANWTGNVNSSNPAPAYPSLFGSSMRSPALPVSVSFATP